MFKDLSAMELLGSIRNPDDIVDLYRVGLKEQNAIVAICAQRELFRRGDSDLAVDTIKENINKLEPDTTFTHLMCKSFLELTPNVPALRLLDRYVRTEVMQNKRTPSLEGFDEFVNGRNKSEESTGINMTVSDIIAKYKLSIGDILKTIDSAYDELNSEDFYLEKSILH